jgi:hypothetical protein
MSTLEGFALHGDSGAFPPEEPAKKITLMDLRAFRERRERRV